MPERGLTGGDLYDRLPLFVKEMLVCKCAEPSWDFHVDGYSKHHPFFKHWCLACGKAHPYFATYMVQTCEVCDKYYLPKVTDYDEYRRTGDPRVFHRIKHRICSACSVDSGPRTKRTGFKFS